VKNNSFYVDFWSTPYFDVTSKRKYYSTPHGGCSFKVSDTRRVYLDGKLVKKETQYWTYRHTVDCHY
jgi:hypothetical protein